MPGARRNRHRLVSSVEIDAEPQQVWERLADIAGHVSWMADARSIRFLTDQREGVGTVFVCRTVVGPLRTDDRMEVTEWAPGRAMGVAHSGVVTGAGRFELTPLDDGRRTSLSWTEDLRLPWWLAGRLGATVAGPVLARIWRANLRRFAEQVTLGARY